MAAGKFKETNFGAVVEAVLNLGISILLVWKYGLIGVAIGTLIATVYRMLYFVRYLNQNVLKRKYRTYIVYILSSISVLVVNLIAYSELKIKVATVLDFCCYGLIAVLLNTVLYIVIFNIFKLIIKQIRRAIA